MSIAVKFFASLSEAINLSETQVTYQAEMTVERVWQLATGQQPCPNNTLAALNMEYVGFDQTVNNGDEVAFFPPVAGG